MSSCGYNKRLLGSRAGGTLVMIVILFTQGCGQAGVRCYKQRAPTHTTTSNTERAAAICFELSAVFAEAARSGRAHERIDELVAACERAQREIAALVR